MDKIIKALLALGLSEKEAGIYVALYKLGEATSYEVAKESGIKRPTVYMLMESLRKKGLVLVVPHAKKQIFVAKNPREFIGEYQSKFNESVSNLLSALPRIARPVTNIVVFKGVGALAQGLSYGLHDVKEKTIYAFWAGIGKNTKVGGVYFEHYNQLNKLGFKLKGIVPADSRDEGFRDADKERNVETKKIDHKLFSPAVSTEVCGSLVKTIFHKKKEVVVIDDQELSNFYIQIFNFLWNSGR